MEKVISNELLLRFICSLAGIGLGLSIFTLNRVFADEELASTRAIQLQGNEVRSKWNEQLIGQIDQIQRERNERLAVVESEVKALRELVNEQRHRQP